MQEAQYRFARTITSFAGSAGHMIEMQIFNWRSQ